MNRILIGLLGVLLMEVGLADVQLLIRDGSGSVSLVSSDGKHARIKDKRMRGYVLVDYAEAAIYMVDPQKREIMRSSLGADGDSASMATGVSLESQGGGPRVAGYKTRKYRIRAGGEDCGSVYASKDLLKLREIQSLFEAMRSLQQRSRQMMGGMSGFLNACQQASLQVAAAMEEKGAPMRIMDVGGQLQSEVMEVKTGQKFPAGHYSLPAGMKIVDMDEKMKQAGQQTQQMMENMPDMNQIMEQMQQGGGQMTEEMKQQMLKLQDALKQMQQQQQ